MAEFASESFGGSRVRSLADHANAPQWHEFLVAEQDAMFLVAVKENVFSALHQLSVQRQAGLHNF